MVMIPLAGAMASLTAANAATTAANAARVATMNAAAGGQASHFPPVDDDHDAAMSLEWRSQGRNMISATFTTADGQEEILIKLGCAPKPYEVEYRDDLVDFANSLEAAKSKAGRFAFRLIEMVAHAPTSRERASVSTRRPLWTAIKEMLGIL